MRKILIVQRFDTTNIGCAERVWRQAEELHARGYEITLIQYPHAERREALPAMRPEAPPGVRVLSLSRNGTDLPRNTQILTDEIGGADLVHLWKCYPDTAVPVLWGLRRNPRPLHYDWDDLEGGEGGIAHRLTDSRLVGTLLSKWERWILDWADSVSVASAQIGQLCREYGFPESSIFFCPVGAHPKPVDIGSVSKWEPRFGGKRVFAFLGQMEAEDFPIEVLQGVSRVLKARPELHLAMVGDGPGRGKLEQKVRELSIADRCTFTGYLPHEEAQAILSLSTGFLFPLKDDLMSRCKSPLVVVESLSHGTPTIGSDVGEVPEMVGDCGVLVSGLESDAWERGFQEFLAKVDSEADLRQRCRERFLSQWTWRGSVDNLEKAYQHAVSNFQRLKR